MQIKTIKTAWSPTDLKHNTYIVEENDKCVIIDAGAPLEEVRNVTNAEIEAVFITHGHLTTLSTLKNMIN